MAGQKDMSHQACVWQKGHAHGTSINKTQTTKCSCDRWTSTQKGCQAVAAFPKAETISHLHIHAHAYPRSVALLFLPAMDASPVTQHQLHWWSMCWGAQPCQGKGAVPHWALILLHCASWSAFQRVFQKDWWLWDHPPAAAQSPGINSCLPEPQLGLYKMQWSSW